MPPKKSKSRLDIEQPIKAWEQGLQSATFSEEVDYILFWVVVLIVYTVDRKNSYLDHFWTFLS